MARWFAALALLLVALASSASAQGFTTFWVFPPDFGAPPLTTTCNGPTPIPDGRLIRIFWDVDNDGPDLTDPLATLCTNPPLCEDGPPGTFNYNEFPLNGEALGFGAGYFYTDNGFACQGEMPNPPRYYLRVYETDGINFLWTSSVKTMTTGFQEIYMQQSDWTCGAGGPQCTVRDEHE